MFYFWRGSLDVKVDNMEWPEGMVGPGRYKVENKYEIGSTCYEEGPTYVLSFTPDNEYLYKNPESKTPKRMRCE